MLPLPAPSPDVVRSRRLRAPFGRALFAAACLLLSAVLQLFASFERWVTAANGWNREGSTVEDHTFDYYLPADPWENLGSAAELFGAGFILAGVGVFAVAQSAAGSRFDRVTAAVISGSFVIIGGHALLSRLLNTPTVLQYGLVLTLLGALQFVRLVILGIRFLPSRPSVSLVCFFLLGITGPGYLFATFVIAPMIVSYQSHDTTPWTETILAAWTAAAAITVLASVVLSGRTLVRKEVGHVPG